MCYSAYIKANWFLKLFIVHVHVWACACQLMGRSVDNLWDSIPSFHHVDPKEDLSSPVLGAITLFDPKRQFMVQVHNLTNSKCFLHSSPGLCCSPSHHAAQTWKAGTLILWQPISSATAWEGLPESKGSCTEPFTRSFSQQLPPPQHRGWKTIEQGPLRKAAA